MTRRTLALALVVPALALSACGGSEESSVTTDEEGPATTSTQPAAQEGGQLFATTCGGCHALAAAETEGSVGPNLDDLKPDEQRVLSAIAEGPGAMPSNLLDGEDAQSVATFVAENAGK